MMNCGRDMSQPNHQKQGDEMGTTRIEWCDKSWNIITGCSPVSEGCENCYARRMAHRLKGRFGYPKDDPFRVTFHPDRLEEPLHWKKASRIFVCSMGDLFHEQVKTIWIEKIFKSMVSANWHKYLILTKRPSQAIKIDGWIKNLSDNIDLVFGISIENQPTADERIPILCQIPAAIKFVSVEPMLENIHIYRGWFGLNGINWVICGAETGPKARPMNPDWARDLFHQCRTARIPFFFKQMSAKQPIPKDLMIKEFPK